LDRDLFPMNMQEANDFRDRLREKPQLGLGIMYPAAGIIERIGPDWDWIWIDGQHGEMGYSDTLAAVRACNLIRRPAIVRVPGHDAGAIGKALDTAADGVMVPMVDDAGQARQAVRAAKFPPLGARSYGGRRPIDLAGRGYAHQDRVQPLLICQIETPAGLENAEAIAGVEGVDVIFFGADDLRLRSGLPMDATPPAGCFDDALRTVASAARAHGKIAGGVFPSAPALGSAVQLGYRLIVGCADVTLLAGASEDKARSLRDCLKGP